jgi:hypothetical protein
MIEVCDGGVFGAWLKAHSKNTVSRAKASMFGLVARW